MRAHLTGAMPHDLPDGGRRRRGAGGRPRRRQHVRAAGAAVHERSRPATTTQPGSTGLPEPVGPGAERTRYNPTDAGPRPNGSTRPRPADSAVPAEHVHRGHPAGMAGTRHRACHRPRTATTLPRPEPSDADRPTRRASAPHPHQVGRTARRHGGASRPAPRPSRSCLGQRTRALPRPPVESWPRTGGLDSTP